MKGGMKLRRPKEDVNDNDAEIGRTFFRNSLVIFAAVILTISFGGPQATRRVCQSGDFCVTPDSTSTSNPDARKEDSSFVGVGNVSRVFTCGIAAWLVPAVELLFPEYCPDRLYVINTIKCRPDRVLRMARSLNLPLEDSLLVVRPTIDGMGFVNESFPGKVLYINTENSAYQIPNSQYGLGPYRNTNHTLRLYLASLYVNTLGEDMKSVIIRPETLPRPKNTKKNFGLFVASGHCSNLRLETVVRLSKVGTMHVAGHCVRRLRKMCRRWGCQVGTNERIVPISVTDRDFNRHSQNVGGLRNQSFWSLHDFYHQYRFAMVFENKRLRGYVTEKIVNAFLGGSVPIYHGTKDVFEVFNPRAMVFFDEQNPNASISFIQTLMENEDAYNEVLNQPILANGTQTVKDIFSLNNTDGNGLLKRRIRKMVLGV